MGSIKLNPCANVIRVILVIINIVFVILGCIVIGIGSWSIAVDNKFSFVISSSIVSGAALMIVAGCLTVIFCTTGILGAIFLWQPLLVTYASVLVIVIALEIVAGIVAFVFSGAVVDELEEGSLRAIRLYPASVDAPNTNSSQRDAKTAINAIQNMLSCCGYNNASDWPRENPMYLAENNGVPPQVGGCRTCFVGTDENCIRFIGTYMYTFPGFNRTVPYNFTASKIGCSSRLEDNLVLIGSVAGAVGVVFGVLEIIGIVLASVLFCCICTTVHYSTEKAVASTGEIKKPQTYYGSI